MPECPWRFNTKRQAVVSGHGSQCAENSKQLSIPPMNDNYLRNREGKIIARLDGNILRDGTGKIVAVYHATENVTRDRTGRIVGTGNQTLRVVGQKEKGE